MHNSSLSFSDLPERWNDLVEFPSYSVSDHGRVLNTRTGFYIKPTKNTRGLAIVGLMKSGIQHKRSLGLLVADAFLSRLDNPAFDTPINLDGDRMNNHYTNLMWRPLWFARKYSQQFTDGHPTFDQPIEDVETREIYPTSMHASVANGVLDLEVYVSMINNTYVWPTGQVFRVVELEAFIKR
jgi:NUMOD4 motif